MRFNNDEDYAIVTNIMRDLGLQIRPQTPKIQVPPSPAPSTVMSSSPALAADSLQGLLSRPISAFSNLSDDISSGRAKLPPYAEFKVPERPETAESLRQRPSSSQSRPSSSQSGSGALDSLVSLVPLPSAIQSRTTSFREPPTSLYLSQLEREVRKLYSHCFCQRDTRLTLFSLRTAGPHSHFRILTDMRASAVKPNRLLSQAKCNCNMQIAATNRLPDLSFSPDHHSFPPRQMLLQF